MLTYDWEGFGKKYLNMIETFLQSILWLVKAKYLGQMLGKDKKCKADLVHKHVLVPQHMNIYTLIPLPISTFYSVSQSCLERYSFKDISAITWHDDTANNQHHDA